MRKRLIIYVKPEDFGCRSTTENALTAELRFEYPYSDWDWLDIIDHNGTLMGRIKVEEITTMTDSAARSSSV